MTNSDRATEKLGEEFSDKLLPGSIVGLYGGLGSGKTTFTKGLAKGFGIQSRIISPTFMIVRTHKLSKPRSGIETLYHIDLYRLEDRESVNNLGLEEMFEEPGAVTILEWADRVESVSARNRWEIKFEISGKNKRKISMENVGHKSL